MKSLFIGLAGPAGSGKDTIADHLVAKHGFVKMANADLLKRMVQLAFAFTDDQLWGPSEMRNAPDHRYPREHGPFTKGPQAPRCMCCGVEAEVDTTLAYELFVPRNAPRCFLTPRFALQSLGTEWGRMCFENIWVGRLLGLAQELQAGGCYYDAKSGIRRVGEWVNGPEVKAKTNVVIPDVRFINEVDAIRAAGGKMVRVVRGMVDVFEQHPAGDGWISEHKLGEMGPSVILQEHTSISSAAAQHQSETELLKIPPDRFHYVVQNSGDLHFLRLQVDRMLDVLTNKVIPFDRGLQDAPPFLREKCRELAAYMSDLSKKYFGSDWHEATSARLWYALQNGGELGFANFDTEGKHIEEAEFDKLGALYDAVNGWFSWRDKSYDAPYFVRRGDWLEEYKERS